MAERETLEDAGFILYADVLDRLQRRFPDVAPWRIAQIVAAENDAITGGVLRIVPSEVESGAEEMLEREIGLAQKSGEVA